MKKCQKDQFVNIYCLKMKCKNVPKNISQKSETKIVIKGG